MATTREFNEAMEKDRKVRAAAYDLLKACKFMVDKLKTDHNPDFYEAEAMMLYAIAKAENIK